MELRSRQSDKAKAFISELCFEHAEEAWHLWDLRGLAVRAPHYTLADLQAHDERLDAHIDALKLEGDAGWAACANALSRGNGGHFFAAALLAFERGDSEKINLILEKAALSEEAIEGVIRALGWLNEEQAEAPIKQLFASKDPLQIRIGLAASVLHRQDPGHPLDSALASEDAKLAQIALRAAGVIRHRNGKHIRWSIEDQLKSDNDHLRFWASWAGALLGYEDMIPVCKSFVRPDSPHAQDALNLVIRKISRTEAILWTNELSGSIAMRRLAMIGCGLRGDTVSIPWLIDCMMIPQHARIAAEAVCRITGVDMDSENLIGPCPEGFESGPTDDPKDDPVALDPDEHLPWPDAKAFTVWWNKNKTHLPKETRLLLGKPITETHLKAVLQTGLQRHRQAAALELACVHLHTPVFNTTDPARRQIAKLYGANKSDSPARVIPPNYGTRPLAITAVNCITPIGLDARQTAASVRAGIVRFALSDDYQDANGKPVTLAKIQGVRDDVANVIERIRDVAEVCLDDMLDAYFETTKQNPNKAHFILGAASQELPGPEYGDENMIILKHVIAERFSDFQKTILTTGNASLHYAISEAAKVIQNKPDTLCIIGCVDSLHRESILDYFEEQGRLKSPGYGRHSGLIASEAVSFMVVEDLERARQAGRPILARISTLGLSEEPKPRSSEQSGISKGLTDACQAAMNPLADRELQTIIGDLNGEDARATEWGVVCMRIFPKDKKQPHLKTPAEYYGDIGAASGAVMTAVSALGLHNAWLDSPVLIFCSDDFGPCGAVVLEKEM